MNCRNCGAAMELFPRRSYFFCRYCGTFEFIPAADVAGLRRLESASAAACPACRAPLADAVLDDAPPVKHCARCGGLLMACGDFADAVGRRRARASAPPAAPVPLDARELERQIACPSCAQQMDVHPYGGPGNIVIDTCSACGVVWLDRGELTQVTDAPGRDRTWTPSRQ